MSKDALSTTVAMSLILVIRYSSALVTCLKRDEVLDLSL